MLVLDILFHDIHPHGIYHSLCRAGIVGKQAQLLNDFNVNEAMRSAPAGTRAEARGKAISEAAKDPGVMADWTMVRSNNREARFEKPYESKYSWRELQKSKGK